MVDAMTVGFIGLGNMGARMCRCLVEAGYHVVGYDRLKERVIGAGATVSDSIAELAGQVPAIFLSLPNSDIVEEVVEGPDGILEGKRTGQTVFDLSTSAPSSTMRLHSRLREEGINYIDAGISGGAARAEKGSLTLMVGGDREVVQENIHLVDPFAKDVFYMGESGTGHTTKLLNNFLNAISLAATAEVMVAGKKAGLDLHKLLDVLNTSSGVNFATKNRFPNIVDGNYMEGGLTGKLMMKDVILYLDRMHELGISSLNASGPVSSFGLATALGYGDEISNKVVDAIGDVSGGIRLFSV